jgi:NhaA family Na+:H+ antiporter
MGPGFEGVPGRLVGGEVRMSHRVDPGSEGSLRATWSRSGHTLARVIQPLQAFLDTEASGGILLLLAAAAALAWANSPWRASYEALWTTTLGFDLGGFGVAEDLRHWVNDGLMALFFFVVGLEIKRELTTGELRSPRSVALPAIAALGGMVVPAAIYLALNAGGEGAAGWGIPMATDIAFAVGVLTLAARHAPSGLKPFLLTLAIVDDIGAIIVLAIFYTDDIDWAALAVAAGIVVVIVGLRRRHVRFLPIYVALGAAVWLATFESGVHATIAGVVLGLLTPSIPFQRPDAVSREAHRVADETLDHPDPPDADAAQWLLLASLSRETVSSLARLEALLHPWTSFVVVPLFALANAGVYLSGGMLREAVTSPISLGVILGLVVGKTVGITCASWIAIRTGVGALPAGVRWSQLAGAAIVAGIGFTVSLLVAGLAFGEGPRLDIAKAGILAASTLAGVGGYLVISRTSASR